MTRALRDIPAVRALAEREARERYDAMRGYAEQHPRDPVAGHRRVIRFAWEDDDGLREWWIEAHLDLLTDLSRPASRDALARLVAEAVGLECGATAPEFRIRDGEEPTRWALLGHFDERESTHERPRGYVSPAPDSWLLVPALVDVTDPAEALAIIADAVLT